MNAQPGEESDLTSRIERLEAFEERCGVRLDALFAKGDGYSLKVNGELHPQDGPKLKQNVMVVVDVYDAARRLVENGGECFFAESFFGFETFSLLLVPKISDISKIRVYPKPL